MRKMIEMGCKKELRSWVIMLSLSFTGLVKKSVGSQPVTATASIYYFCFPPCCCVSGLPPSQKDDFPPRPVRG